MQYQSCTTFVFSSQSFYFDCVKDDHFYGCAYTKRIVCLKTVTWTWSEAGRTNLIREYHGAIWANSKLVVVGGWFNTGNPDEVLQTEFCEWNNNEFTCELQQSGVHDYGGYPLLFAVSDDFNNC